ncbi:Hsp70 family protein [Aldersonia sp. NBC_00410]|uniref:Rv0361 family membrane protein n=1 Tax=Aldersonia sp. NBC_00410 TaxID=2975954 RepID=UPI002259D33F|nr:Hsp70 family protein [Aldersonia sp. NBC_00410]MCX5044849.1 Hsp70 family protein [Aldersonia sp. NBC_00410]
MTAPHHTAPSAGWVLAVDFGTSNTAAAARAADGRVTTLALSHQSNLMPSAVFVQSPEEILVGQVALNAAATNPAAFLAAPKRSIPHGVVNANGYDVPVQQPVAAVLRSVLDRAVTAHRGQSPARVVLTHPEGWSPTEIRVLVEAAGLAGIPADRVSTISEPRAAAAHYSRSEPLAVGEKIAVFDFGGGTLDVAVLQATDAGEFTVIAAGGDNQLGGKNLDAVIRRWIDTQLRDDDPDLLSYLQRGAPLETLRALDESIRRAKELLSETAQATITVTDPRSDGRRNYTLGRTEFDELIGDQIERSLALTRDTFGRAGITGPGDLRALFLTGGSSRIPLVHTRLQQVGPVATLDDPKTVVARGALTEKHRPTPAATDRAAPPRNTDGRHAKSQSSASTAEHPDTGDTRNAGSAEPAAPARPMRGRGRLIALVLAVIVVLGGVGYGISVAMSGTGGEGAAASSEPRSKAEDEAAIRAFIPDYIDTLNSHDKDAIAAMRCENFVPAEGSEEVPADQQITLNEIISVSVSGDTAGARVRFTATHGTQTNAPATVVFNLVYEDGWKFCSATT